MSTIPFEVPPAPDSDLCQQALIAAAKSIIITENHGDDTAIIFANPAFERLTGYELSEIIGRDYQFLQGPETSLEATQAMNEAVRAGRAHKTVLRHYRKDGSLFWNDMAFVPIHDALGRNTYFVGVQADVSAAHEAQAERQRLEAKIEQARRDQITCVRDILHSVTENRFHLCQTHAQLPPQLPLTAESVGLGAAEVRLLRHAVLRASDDIQMPPERSDDFVVAVGEAATNAVVHGGGGRGEVRSNGEVVQVWITDEGPGIGVPNLHRAILERGFSTRETMGYGYWVIICTCDEVWLQTDPRGTTLVLQQGISTRSPHWLTQINDATPYTFGSGEALVSW